LPACLPDCCVCSPPGIASHPPSSTFLSLPPLPSFVLSPLSHKRKSHACTAERPTPDAPEGSPQHGRSTECFQYAGAVLGSCWGVRRSKLKSKQHDIKVKSKHASPRFAAERFLNLKTPTYF